MEDNKQIAVQRWLTKADHDLQTAKLALELKPELTDSICFHAQQCVEKCLKAYIVNLDEHIRRTHDLTPLVSLCEKYEPEFSKFHDIADELSGYAIITRYPDDWREIPREEAAEAVRKAETVMKFVIEKLKNDIFGAIPDKPE